MTVQIWLGDHYSHFDKAIAIFDENRVEDVHAIIHQGMLCDTVLLGTSVEMHAASLSCDGRYVKTVLSFTMLIQR